ncbi:FHA domain-containing protein [Solimonas sp. K1W22B-7]|uniref:FHA domain-containing protein n=1 Tax=Solimonas sp. K1W22B-7 TaxID=2303331 RepID=UPI0013C44222|nr:FHA domain-containing protein [Solimonas sp. K1W22B-7]
MAKIVRSTRNGPEEIELGSFQLTIGRRPDNNIVIDNAYTAPLHAVVGFADGRHYIQDLKTSQGTRVNGSAVQQAALRHGDTILIGLQRLEFIDPAPARPAAPIPAKPAAPAAKPASTRPPLVVPPVVVTPVVVPPRAAAPPATPPPVAAPPAPRPAVALPPLPTAATPAAPIDGLDRFTALPDAPAESLGLAPDPTPTHMLDQLVGSIRSHREREQSEREQVQERLRGEWNLAVTYAEQLKLKLDGDPRVHYFTISRRNNDLIIRSQRSPDSPIQFTQLSMDHPEDKGHALTGLWLRRSGQHDRCYETAREALSELIRELAFLLA